MIEVDVRGFSCPIPVVRTKKAIEEHAKEGWKLDQISASTVWRVRLLALTEGM